MKIQAKDLKKGQTMKTGNLWLLISETQNGKLKNGRDTKIITGTTLAGIIKRANGFKQRVEALDYKIEIKSETLVNIK